MVSVFASFSHVFSILYGKLQHLITGPIGKQLYGDASAPSVVEFEKIPTPNVPVLAQETIDDLSFDHYYAHKISIGVISGNIQDLPDLKVGLHCHARWFTLACHILKLYVSQKHPPDNLVNSCQILHIRLFSIMVSNKGASFHY